MARSEIVAEIVKLRNKLRITLDKLKRADILDEILDWEGRLK